MVTLFSRHEKGIFPQPRSSHLKFVLHLVISTERIVRPKPDDETKPLVHQVDQTSDVAKRGVSGVI